MSNGKECRTGRKSNSSSRSIYYRSIRVNGQVIKIPEEVYNWLYAAVKNSIANNLGDAYLKLREIIHKYSKYLNGHASSNSANSWYEDVGEVDHLKKYVETFKTMYDYGRAIARNDAFSLSHVICRDLHKIDFDTWLRNYFNKKLIETRKALIAHQDTIVNEEYLNPGVKVLIKQAIEPELEFVNLLLSNDKWYLHYARNIYWLVREEILKPSSMRDKFVVAEAAGKKMSVNMLECMLCKYNIEIKQLDYEVARSKVQLSQDQYMTFIDSTFPTTTWRSIFLHFLIKHSIDLLSQDITDKIKEWKKEIRYRSNAEREFIIKAYRLPDGSLEYECCGRRFKAIYDLVEHILQEHYKQ